MIDLDNFKKINDIYGHDIGDEVLKVVARTLSFNLRSFDFLSRWGGDEFMAIIVNVNEEELYFIGNKLRILVKKSMIRLKSDTTGITISIGATLVRQNDEMRVLLKRADQLMYHSKHSGGDRISTESNIRQA